MKATLKLWSFKNHVLRRDLCLCIKSETFIRAIFIYKLLNLYCNMCLSHCEMFLTYNWEEM